MAGKVLIADAVATNRIVLRARLAASHYSAELAASGRDVLARVRADRPDLVILSCSLTDMSAPEVCRQLKDDFATRDVPVIVLTARHDPAERLAALRAGADEVYARPIDELLFQARIRSLMRVGETQAQLGLREGTARALGFSEPGEPFRAPGLVCLVADRIEEALHLKRDLQPLLEDRLLVATRDTALADGPEGAAADVYVICGELGLAGDTLRFMSELRSRPASRNSPVCLMLPQSSGVAFATAFDLGASDLIDCAAPSQEAALRILSQVRLKRRADRLRSTVADGLRLAVVDPLTGLHNRRYALPQLARLVQRCGGRRLGLAVMLLDLDRFKAVNDTWGHATGDAVLTEVARRLKGALRASDMLARIGGEEFLVALPETSFDEARETAERLRRAICDSAVAQSGGQSLSITLSIGLAMGCGPTQSAEELVACADRALMAAKSDGRNQVIVHRSAA